MKHEIITGLVKSIKYRIVQSKKGYKYIPLTDVIAEKFNYSVGNSKLGQGKALNYGLSIEYTCKGDAPCKKLGVCYGTSGCFSFGENLKRVAENTAFVLSHNHDEIMAVFQKMIDDNPKIKFFRHFEVGDIPTKPFIGVMVDTAINNPHIKFWCYTKKYELVNAWVDENGLDAIPSNLVIVFSHWRNDDGTYYTMPNPYMFPTSEFIPLGQEELAEQVTHICPCSNPDVFQNCVNCDHPCYELKHGESMALLEHSTTRTKKRDGIIKKAHDAIKKAKKKVA